MNYSKEVSRLLSRLKCGENCFEKLYNLTYKHLLVIAKIYLKDKSMADDVLAESYISVYKNIGSFNEERNGYNWLCKIVQNKSYNFNRAYLDYEILDNGLIEGLIGHENTNIDSDIEIALDKLEVEERQIIIMRFFEDKTLEEIAKIKNISIVAVHKRIKKVLKKLELLL